MFPTTKHQISNHKTLVRSHVSFLKVIVLCALAMLMYSGLEARQTVFYLGGKGQAALRSSAGFPLPNDVTVQIGVITDDLADVSQLAADPAVLQANWTAVGTTATRRLASDYGSFADRAMWDDAALTGKKLYLLVIRTDDGQMPAQDWSNVIEYGLYSSTQVNWLMPDTYARPPQNLTQINSTQVDEAFYGQVSDSALVLSPIANATETQLAAISSGDPLASDSTTGDTTGDTFGTDTGDDSDTNEHPGNRPFDFVGKPNEDDDNDGISNIVEWALNKSSNQANGNAFQLKVGKRHKTDGSEEMDSVSVVFTRRTGHAWLRVSAEATYDFQSWDAPVTETILSRSSGFETVEASVPAAGQQQAFIRIKVETD